MASLRQYCMGDALAQVVEQQPLVASELTDHVLSACCDFIWADVMIDHSDDLLAIEYWPLAYLAEHLNGMRSTGVVEKDQVEIREYNIPGMCIGPAVDTQDLLCNGLAHTPSPAPSRCSL